MALSEREIIESLTVQDRGVLLEKYGLSGGDDATSLDFYNKRGAVLGRTGEVGKNITTGPCLLGLTDIERIKQDPGSFGLVVGKQPTLQNVVNVAYRADGDIHICLETHEFASMAVDVFDTEYDKALKDFIKAAKRCERIIRRLSGGDGNKLFFHYTHEPELDQRLARITNAKKTEFLALLEKKKSERKIHARIRKQIEAGRDPNEIFKLRIYASYTPGWWDGGGAPHTIVENIYNINKYIDTDLNPSWAALVPLRSLDWKREMAQGECIYTGTAREVEKTLDVLKSRLPQRSPQHCNVGNILPYASGDLSTLVECYNERTVDKNRCDVCFGKVKEFLLNITKAL